MSNEKILMSEMEYQGLLAEQAEANKQLQEAFLERTGVRMPTATAEASHNLNEITRLAAKLASISDRISRAQVVVPEVTADISELGDVLSLALINGEARNEITVRLVGEAKFAQDGIMQISISSPLGVAIYHKSVGSIQKYKAPNGEMEVEILAKLDLTENAELGR